MGKELSLIFWEVKHVSAGSGRSCPSMDGKISYLGRGQKEVSVSRSGSAMLRLTWAVWSRASLASSFLLQRRKREQKIS